MNRIIASSVLSLFALPLAAQEHDLKLTAAPGSSVWLRQISTQIQRIDMGGQEMESKNSVDIVAHIAIKSVGDEGAATVEARLARVRGTFGVPQIGDFTFDSLDNDVKADEGDDGADDFGGMMPDFGKIGKAAASIAGAKFTAVLDRYGEITSVEGVEEALAAMNERAGQMGSQMLIASFSDKTIRNLIESAFGERPSGPTAVGGTWQPKRSDASKDGTEAKVTLTLARVTDKAFEITGDGTIEKPKETAEGGDSEEDEMIREMRKNMKLENGKITTRAVVSRQDGFLVEASTELSMDVTMPGPFGDMSMKHRTTIETTRTTEAAAMAREQKAADK